MSEVSYYRLKQLVKLTKIFTYFDKSKNNRNNVLLKKRAISQEKQHFWDSFLKLEKEHYIDAFFFKFLKAHENECNRPLYSKKTIVRD